ncbi:MAG: hypothetical protein KGL35_11580 [Bradyrhizobium sp.]|jgi:hypothetical protein|nr:hypothetical protein [Bradyrhizobium sp.]
MNADGLQFEEATHTYRLNGRKLPSVTAVIRDVLAPNEYANVPAHILKHAADRGKAVERMIELDLHDELDEDSLAPELLSYWQAWRAFPVRAAWRDAECKFQGFVCHTERGYAGCYDLFIPSERLLIDIKATAMLPHTVGVQTAAYADAIGFDGPLTRYCLHVKPDGCRLHPLADKSESADFLAALRVYNWRLRHDA